MRFVVDAHGDMFKTVTNDRSAVDDIRERGKSADEVLHIYASHVSSDRAQLDVKGGKTKGGTIRQTSRNSLATTDDCTLRAVSWHGSM